MSRPTPTTVENYFNMIQIDNGHLKSEPPHMAGAFIRTRVFGGLLVSQAVNAFTTSHPGLIPQTVNYKFVGPAHSTLPLEFKVTDFPGANIASIRAHQGEKIVGQGHVRYTKDADYLDSSPYLCPNYIGEPEEYPDTVELEQMMEEGRTKMFMKELNLMALDIKPFESPLFPSTDVDRTCMWLRIKSNLQDSLQPKDGPMVVLFFSDFAILQIADDIYQKNKIKIKTGASLHHSVWFHEKDFDPRAWYLTVVECHVISHGRARLESFIYNRNRKCVMTVVQEGFMQADMGPKL